MSSLSYSPRFGAPNQKIANNRRKFKIPHGKNHPIVFKKAEDIAGYEKFTLDEVVFPEAKSDDQVKVNIIFFFWQKSRLSRYLTI